MAVKQKTRYLSLPPGLTLVYVDADEERAQFVEIDASALNTEMTLTAATERILRPALAAMRELRRAVTN